MGDEQQVGSHARDRRVVPAHPALGQRPQVVEGVDEDRRRAVGEAERGLSVPLNLHVAPRVRPCADGGGSVRRRARAARPRGPCARRASARPPAAIRQATIANANAACRPSRNGPEMSVGKNELPVSAAWSCADSPASTCGPEQVLDRVVAEEGGEQDRDRRQRRHVVRGGGGRRRAPAGRRSSSPAASTASPMIISVKKIPIDSTWAEFWNVWFIAPPAPRSPVRQAVHHRRAVGRGEHAHRRPDEQQDRAEDRVGEVGRQQHQQAEADRGQHHPGGRERARAEAVGQVARGRAGAQHPDRQRQHVDARPQRRLGEVVAVLRAARCPAAR